MKVIDVVRNDNMAKFSHYCGGNLYYTVDVDYILRNVLIVKNLSR